MPLQQQQAQLDKTKSDKLSRVDSSLSTLFREPAECAVFASYGINDLTPIDILVKATDSDNACIKARFALSIKVEEFDDQWPANQTNRPILGYVPLEHVISVEESCPESRAKGPPDGVKNGTISNRSSNEATGNEQAKASETPPGKDDDTTSGKKDEGKRDSEEDDELEMIVTFDCGKLSFTFRKDKDRVYVSAIKGVVKLGEFLVAPVSPSLQSLIRYF